MKFIIGLLVIISLFSCKEKDQDLDLKYQVINQLIKSDQEGKSDLQYLYKSYSATNFHIINLDKEKVNDLIIPSSSIKLKSDSLFSPEDIEFLISQTIPYQSKIFDLDEKKVSEEIKIIKELDLDEIKNNYEGARDYWARFNKKFGEKCVRSYSEPIFNLKKDICIIQTSESCGPLWGGGQTSIYKKINGNWKILKTLDRWVS